ncbi:uncharacterized protein A4U43_C01F32750 [Asparagus officinalis]|uniref:Uncharacterized protein n=1 Tax=Asparagus officinalis TaxID=4686 RepID=A0A5P1FTX4_ASPOF|nr:uncharacterized protein A4U43_C01F32750 [Asparagus officinalis]
MHRRGRSSASASREELGLQRGRSTGEELGVGVIVGVDSREARRGERNSSSRGRSSIFDDGGARGRSSASGSASESTAGELGDEGGARRRRRQRKEEGEYSAWERDDGRRGSGC